MPDAGLPYNAFEMSGKKYPEKVAYSGKNQYLCILEYYVFLQLPCCMGKEILLVLQYAESDDFLKAAR